MKGIDDDLRTAIQDYLIDFSGCEMGKSEEVAEGLVDYLDEKGWTIVDKIHQANRERYLKEREGIKKDCPATTEQS